MLKNRGQNSTILEKRGVNILHPTPKVEVKILHRLKKGVKRAEPTVITSLMFNHFKSLIWLTRKPLLVTSFSYPDLVPGCLWDCYILTSEVTEVVRLLLLDHL